MSYYCTPTIRPEYLSKIEDIVCQNGEKVEFDRMMPVDPIAPDGEGEDFYYIDKGRIRYVYTNFDGEERILSILGKGFFVGGLYTYDKIVDITYDTIPVAVTESPCVFYKISKNNLKTLLKTNELFNDYFFEVNSSYLTMIISNYVGMSLSSCKDRLYELFVAYIDKESIKEGNWYELQAKYQRQDLAKIIGSTRGTLTNTINELCEEGLIRVINNKIEVRVM